MGVLFKVCYMESTTVYKRHSFLHSHNQEWNADMAGCKQQSKQLPNDLVAHPLWTSARVPFVVLLCSRPTVKFQESLTEDKAMSSVERDSLNLGFPYLLFYASIL